MRRFLLSIILVCVLILPASAHPGGADSSGGHYDHSTGEYHYHHGYGAHDHEDLDGDGDLDCPYNFKDKTGESSGESSGSVTRYPTPTRPPTPPAPAVAEPEQGGWLKAVWEAVMLIGIVIVAFIVMLLWMAPIVVVQLAFMWLRDRFRKPDKDPEWKPSPQRIPGKRPDPPETAEQLSFFEGREVRTMNKRTYNILVYALAAIVLIGCWILFADKPTEAEKRKALEENPKYQQGYEAGYNAGLEEGWEDGFEDGLSEGYEEGFDEGRSEGYDEGYDDGYQEGYDRGYDNGYEDCWYDN